MFPEALRLFIATRREVFGQFVRYAAVGATMTVLDFSIYLGLTRGTALFAGRFVAAATASFLCAVCVSFVLNNFWTFRHDHRGWHRRAPKFLAVAVVGLALNAGILHGLVLLGLHDILAKIMATGVVTGWNFTMQRFWTFRVRE